MGVFSKDTIKVCTSVTVFFLVHIFDNQRNNGSTAFFRQLSLIYDMYSRARFNLDPLIIKLNIQYGF